MTSKRQDCILAFLQKAGLATRNEIAQHLARAGFVVSNVTLLRDLGALVHVKLVQRSGAGRGTRYALGIQSALTFPVDVDVYFALGQDERMLKSPGFDCAIFQELHHLLGEEDIAELEALNRFYLQKRAKLSPGLVRRELERFTIEFSWKSSRMEGNTYTVFEAEHLLKENVAASGKSAEEAQMLLNHKKALDHVLKAPENFREISIGKILELHRLLVEGLSITPGIRNGRVGIVGSNYSPPENRVQIEEAMEGLVALLHRTKHPLERAMLAVLLLSCIQPFEDGNKRTARVLGNAILVAADYCPLSNRSVDETGYRKAVLLFCEQNNLGYFRKLFLEQFRMAVNTYF